MDAEVLQACVPGCESVEKTGEWSYAAACKLRMGPVSLNMTGEMRLEDANPPYGCRIVGEGRDRARRTRQRRGDGVDSRGDERD